MTILSFRGLKQKLFTADPPSPSYGATSGTGWTQILVGAYQQMNDISATEWRQMVAHGVSRGNEVIEK
jgi:hypothetical protein